MDRKYLYEAKEMASTALLNAGRALRDNYGNVAHKTKANASDVVTELDEKTEEFLAEQFARFDPSIGFRGEESGVRTESETTWLVDPIDGTAHFVRGLPFCTSMVALVSDGEVVLSLINDFVRDDLYWAIKGEGAYRNNDQIQISSRLPSNSLVSFESKLELNGNGELREQLRKRTGFISTMNCGFEFAMVASGKLEGRIAKDPYGEDWDFAPGSLLVKEAGGRVTNIGLKTYDYKNHDYLALCPAMYDELVNGRNALFPLVKH